MILHRNAKLGPAGRFALVQAIEGGMSLKAAAAAFSVSPATAHRWCRWLDASEEARRTLSCLFDRSSRPHRSPREPANSYEWPCPGDLLHMDVSRYARFERPGHAVTGDRSQSSRRWMRPQTRVGYDYAHAIVDDHSRLAYVELQPDERAATVTGFVERALAFFAAQGISTRRLMTDNAFSYVKNLSLRGLLEQRGIKHLTTQPYRPRTNGKVERFHQTMAREWAYGLAYSSHRHRNRALPHWLEHYNRRRPHSSLGNRPPLSRVHNVCGQDS